MSAIKTIRKNLFSLATAEIITKVIGTLLYILLARYLGPHGLGIYSIAVSFVTIFSQFSSLGVDSYIIKEIATNPREIHSYLSNSIIIKMIGGVIAYFLVVLTCLSLSYDNITVITIAIFSLTLFFSPINNIYDGVFRGIQRMELSALLNVSRSLLTVSIISSMIFLKRNLFYIVSAHVFTAIILNQIFYFFVIRKYCCSLSSPLNLSHGGKIIKGGFPFLFTGFIYILNSKIDVLMLSKLCGTSSVGYFDAANALILVLMILPSLLSQVLYPFLTQQFSNRSNNMADILNFVQWILAAVSTPMAIGLVFLSNHFIGLFYGSDYNDSAKVLQIMGLGLPIVFMRSIFGWVLAAIDKVNLMMWTNMMGVTLNIILNALLIPKYNSTGAAMATTASNVFSTFVVMAVVKTQVPESKNFLRFYLNPALPGICMGVFLWKIIDLNVFLLVGCGAVIYLMIYFIILGLQKSEEVRIMKKILGIS